MELLIGCRKFHFCPGIVPKPGVKWDHCHYSSNMVTISIKRITFRTCTRCWCFHMTISDVFIKIYANFRGESNAFGTAAGLFTPTGSLRGFFINQTWLWIWLIFINFQSSFWNSSKDSSGERTFQVARLKLQLCLDLCKLIELFDWCLRICVKQLNLSKLELKII